MPKTYADTTLLPAVEKVVQQGLTMFPGSTVTSRARSDARNAAVGGAPDSSHKHRVGFDFVPAKGQAFYQSRGARVLGPGDIGGEAGHLHVDFRGLIGKPTARPPVATARDLPAAAPAAPRESFPIQPAAGPLRTPPMTDARRAAALDAQFPPGLEDEDAR